MQQVRRTAVILALAGMMLRALIPAGWMPNPEGAGKTLFIICDMDMPGMDMSGMHMSGMDMSKMPAKGQDPSKQSPNDSHSHEACPFAAAPHLATPLAVAILALPSLADGFSQLPIRARLALQVSAYAPQSPRAPPAIA